MKFYAHTATPPDGKPDPDQGHWQLLSTHLRNVAQLAKQFAAPLRLSAEAELAGLLHDLGKYRDEFQAYLRGSVQVVSKHSTPSTGRLGLSSHTNNLERCSPLPATMLGYMT